jgi:glycosyltransferase involved in cell wall biosynthesis
MKVAIITNYWKQSDGGGVKNYLINLVDELNKKDNFEVSVLFRQGKDYENYQIEGNKLWFSIKSFFKLREIKPQVIHSQGGWYGLLPGYIYKKIYGSKLIFTFHTQSTERLSGLSIIFFQNMLNGCDCATFVSKSLRENYEKYGLTFKKTAITYAGANSRVVSQEEINKFRNKFGIADGNFVLLAQGLTANELKAEGAKLLIKALKHLLYHHPNIVLILTREGTFSNDLKKIARDENVCKNVIFTGDLDNPFVPLAICDIYTHITLVEGGLSLALLEAMILGKPILATKIGGIPEAINDGVNGILIKPCEEQIIEKVEFLMKSKGIAKKLGDNAKETVTSNFTWEKTADTFEYIYKNY